MKTLFKSALATAAVSAMLAGSALAIVSPGEVYRSVGSGVGGASGIMQLHNGSRIPYTGLGHGKQNSSAATDATRQVLDAARVIDKSVAEQLGRLVM